MISEGNIIEGTVSSVMPFGVFVDLGDKMSGLVHISELSSSYIKDINEYIKKGDTITVKVIKVDEAGKISLSAKQAEKKTSARGTANKQPPRPVNIDWGAPSDENMSFEDKLSKFKQDSDEKMRSLKRSEDSKRAGRYTRKNSHSY